MDKMSKIELTSTISKQSEQLKRYESRLRDVVTAYKGLVREKEALEASLSAINKSEKNSGDDDSVTTLTVSMATLAAEKARTEEAFQNDKRIAREQNDKIVRDLQEKLDNFSKQRQSELDNVRAKLAFEIQEREREHTEHSLLIKELQMKLGAERRSKEKLEDKFVISSDVGGNVDLEKRFRDLNSELEATQRKLNRAEARTLETPHMLVQLQDEIAQMKQNHITALREERVKAKRAEETARKMCASQEERVATLEARLAELSETVGEYDRQRRRDQDVIQQLRENVNTNMNKEKSEETFERERKRSTYEEAKQGTSESGKFLHKTEGIGMPQLQELVEKIHSLKKELMTVNEAMGNPIDIWNIFSVTGSTGQNIHSGCRAELAALRTEYELYKRQLVQNNHSNSDSNQQQRNSNRNEMDKLRSHIKTLQDKVEILNQQMEETEKECEDKINEHLEQIKSERTAHKEELADQRNRVQMLEQQLQTHRERYATLLAEREGEIRARHEKEGEGKNENHSRHDINGSLQEVSAPPHMLHYAHELARKDLEITALRKEKHFLEGQFRDTQRDATIDKDRFKEIRRNLKEEIDRLLRIQSREGANLEYLKNVVLSFLLSTDLYRKKHMLKAIAAVLHFTDAEKESANKIVM